jgi:hypothetical protein
VRLPPITVRCDCGEVRAVPYGDVWVCETCQRRWNTAQIPEDQYFGIIDEMRRYRTLVVGVAVVLAAAILPFALIVSERFFFLLLIVLGIWAFYALPFLRRRVRRRLAERPKWSLHPEP